MLVLIVLCCEIHLLPPGTDADEGENHHSSSSSGGGGGDGGSGGGS